ncbi:hypothetical protein B9Z19DRAFT_567158 [Tuber borchii]|uniref:Uncharacterized protein n=1 Tax=Tuber borchii TaxID=42251 RepID=A0A2T7A274_TUBBO|nr:hypothetical protein B9Z19DRAFT_567158 [Tuber borchii]
MMPALTIDHMIYTLSEIALHCNYHPPQQGSTRKFISEENQHRLQVLNLISLLFVTGGSGDVAAVSLHATSSKRIELCYSKNRPCTPDEKAYITELFTIATDPTSSGETKFSRLLKLVLRKCKDKIITRLHKLCNQLRFLDGPDVFLFVNLNSRAGAGHSPEATQCIAQIRELVGTERYPLDSSLIDFLKRWFQQLLCSLQPGSCFDMHANRHLVYDTIIISHLLANNPQAALIPDPTLVRPIRKLGNYRAAIWVTIEELAKLNVAGECRVSIKEIVPPPPNTQFPSDFLPILNECARDNGTTEVTKEDLSNAYPQEMWTLPRAREIPLQTSVHCECSLALSFAKSHLNSRIPATLIIGISKLPCRWCHEFLFAFHNSYPHITIHFPPFGGKLKSEWTLPPETPSEVVSGMHKRLNEEIKQVLARSIGTRVSHQIPLHPPAVIWRWGSETEDEVIGNQHRYCGLCIHLRVRPKWRYCWRHRRFGSHC